MMTKLNKGLSLMEGESKKAKRGAAENVVSSIARYGEMPAVCS